MTLKPAALIIASTAMAMAVQCCGSDETDVGAGEAGIEACADLLDDAVFTDASIAMETTAPGGIDCTVEVMVSDEHRARFDLPASCPEGASVLLAIDVRDGRWTYDEVETEQIDNGACRPQR